MKCGKYLRNVAMATEVRCENVLQSEFNQIINFCSFKIYYPLNFTVKNGANNITKTSIKNAPKTAKLESFLSVFVR